MFVKDYPHGGCRARVERLFTYLMMYPTITSALLNDLHRPPRHPWNPLYSRGEMSVSLYRTSSRLAFFGQ